MSLVAAPTLGALLDRSDLGLRPIGPVGEADRLRPVRWVHSSDLLDPTPFLSEGVALLTTGTQFSSTDADADADTPAYDAYVARLVGRGITAIGFGTEVVRDGVPSGLATACAAARLPLFEVPFRTPFIAVARANAEAIAAEGFARRSWALAAQRAISLAALRPDALGATLAELSRQLDCWVGLFDETGATLQVQPRPLSQPATTELAGEIEAMLARGVRAAATLRVEGRTFSLQTLGRGGELRGVLVVEGDRLDQEARGVVTSAIAMAGFALEQNQGLSRARRALRAGVVRALLAGDLELARTVASAAWEGLPAEPVLVAVTTSAPEGLSSFLELRATRSAGRFFFGELPDEAGMLMLASGEAAKLFEDAAARGGGPVGVSRPAAHAALSAALDEARVARERGTGAVTAIDAVGESLLGALGDNARAAARLVLAPLAEHDAAHGSTLLASLRTWLEHDGRFEETARALGVHRHTVRARVALAERLLGRDLSTFAVRAEVWVALLAA